MTTPKPDAASATGDARPSPADERDIDWSLGTWEGSRAEQLRRWSRLTLDEIVHAQEEMAELAEWFAAARRGDGDEEER